MAQRVTQHDPRDNISTAREMRRQSQRRLADALTAETGERWTRGMVANLEIRRKILDVNTLMAISKIHNLPCSFYLEPLPGTIEATGLYLSSPVPVAA